MNAAIIFAALATVPQPALVDARCDVLDFNTVLCPEDGHTVLEQVVFLEDLGGDRCIVAWRMKGKLYPYRAAGGWQMLFFDGETLRRVRAPSVIETWYTADYERAWLELWPMQYRRELGK